MTFEDFLKDWHMANDYHGTDDDAPDAFEAWLSVRETEELLKLADLYGKEMKIKGLDRAIEIIKGGKTI